MDTKTFGIVAAKDNRKAQELLIQVSKYLKSKKQNVVTSDFKNCEVIITLGGDGTLLHVSCKYAHLGVPFLGINVGTLGFLTAEEVDNWQKAIDKLTSGRYVVSQRMTIEATVGDRMLRAVNEVVIRGLYRVVDLGITVSEEKFLEVIGDGVIVATQTGSTGYSLSAGGPIVDPDLNCLQVTPINPIGLPIPSVVLSPDDVVAVRVKKGEEIMLIADGQEHTRLEFGDVVTISRGEYMVKYAYFDRHQFIKSLNAKFGFSGRLAK
ncbi:NAD(+)/NADH kinase [Candidatus Curtissbacteria bacterium]|nr:NAD(+)/NADH kinase [Candidatus Curtissbacteria bacterium]